MARRAILVYFPDEITIKMLASTKACSKNMVCLMLSSSGCCGRGKGRGWYYPWQLSWQTGDFRRPTLPIGVLPRWETWSKSSKHDIISKDRNQAPHDGRIALANSAQVVDLISVVAPSSNWRKLISSLALAGQLSGARSQLTQEPLLALALVEQTVGLLAWRCASR